MSILLILFLSIAQADQSTTTDTDDMPKRLYNAYCTSCHTKDEKVIDFDKNKESAPMIAKIRAGDGGMPTYSWMFDDKDLESIIDYMRTLPQ